MRPILCKIDCTWLASNCITTGCRKLGGSSEGYNRSCAEIECGPSIRRHLRQKRRVRRLTIDLSLVLRMTAGVLNCQESYKVSSELSNPNHQRRKCIARSSTGLRRCFQLLLLRRVMKKRMLMEVKTRLAGTPWEFDASFKPGGHWHGVCPLL